MTPKDVLKQFEINKKMREPLKIYITDMSTNTPSLTSGIVHKAWKTELFSDVMPELNGKEAMIIKLTPYQEIALKFANQDTYSDITTKGYPCKSLTMAFLYGDLDNIITQSFKTHEMQALHMAAGLGVERSQKFRNYIESASRLKYTQLKSNN